ncbi:hypothetical protein OR60_14740, partial [Xanthomonas vesicatoria]
RGVIDAGAQGVATALRARGSASHMQCQYPASAFVVREATVFIHHCLEPRAHSARTACAYTAAALIAME